MLKPSTRVSCADALGHYAHQVGVKRGRHIDRRGIVRRSFPAVGPEWPVRHDQFGDTEAYVFFRLESVAADQFHLFPQRHPGQQVRDPLFDAILGALVDRHLGGLACHVPRAKRASRTVAENVRGFVLFMVSLPCGHNPFDFLPIGAMGRCCESMEYRAEVKACWHSHKQSSSRQPCLAARHKIVHHEGLLRCIHDDMMNIRFERPLVIIRAELLKWCYNRLPSLEPINAHRCVGSDHGLPATQILPASKREERDGHSPARACPCFDSAAQRALPLSGRYRRRTGSRALSFAAQYRAPFCYLGNGIRSWPILESKIPPGSRIALTARRHGEILAQGDRIHFSGLESCSVGRKNWR